MKPAISDVGDDHVDDPGQEPDEGVPTSFGISSW